MPPRTRAAEAASQLDPTALEQTGLDPEQVRREIDAAVQQATSQAQSTPASPHSTSPTTTPSSSDLPIAASSPPSTSTSANDSSTRRPKSWELDPTYLEQTGRDPQQVWNEVDAAMRQTSTSRTQGASSPSLPSQPSRNADAVNSPSGSDGRMSTPPSTSPDFSKLFSNLTGVPALGSLLETPPNVSGSSTAAPSDRPPTSNAGVIPADYLLDQLNPANVVDRLTAAFERLKEELEQTVSKYSDVLQYSNNRIDVSDELKEKVGRYKLAVDELNNLPKLESWLMMGLGGRALVVDADAGSPDLRLTPDKLGEWREQLRNAKVVVTRSGSGLDIQFTPDVESAVQDVNKLAVEIQKLNDDYWEQVEDVVNRFNASGRFKIVVGDGGLDIDTSVHEEGFKKVKQLNDEYDARLKELAARYGITIADGEGGKQVVAYADPSKYREFLAKVKELNRWYDAKLNEILNDHGLKVEGGRIVIDMSIYSGVLGEINKINQTHNEKLRNIYSRYGHLLVAVTDEEGRTAYTLRPEVQDALTLHNLVAGIVNIHGATVQQTVQDIADRYGDVLTYDPKTGKVALSKELAEMLGRYEKAVQEVNKLSSALSAVAGMLQTTAQQLPVFTVKFQAYDRATNQWVEVGGETPIYVKDEKMREEIRNWMRQNEGRVKVAAFYDKNRPVVYVYNDRDEGYMIFPTTGEARRARGVSGMVDDTAKAMWYWSLTDEERRELRQYYRLQWEKEQDKQALQNMPPVVREIYGALLSAGQYAPISTSADIVIRAILGREDPLAGTKKIHTQAEAVKEVSPGAYYVGTGIGLAGLVGLGAEAILARGAAKLAAQGGKAAVDDVAKFAVVKKPKLPAAVPIQHVQQTAKAPTVLQTAVAGLKDAAVPMAISGAAFGGLEGAKSYLETGKVDVSRVLEGAAFGSLMGAFPITKRQALAALGVGAGAAAGAGLIRGYDPATSLAVGEAAGLTLVVGGGLKGLSETGAKTPGARAPEVKVADFAAVVKPEGRPAPRVDLSGVDFAKRLSSAVGNVVGDVVSGRVPVEEANLRLGAIRDAVPDKALFDKILQDFKTLSEPPRAPTLDFAAAAKKASEVVSAAESGKMPGYRAFIELADLHASVADKARFDRLFGAKLREYGDQYMQWLLNSGLDKPSVVLQLAKHEGVLGRQFIERYVPDYGKVLAEVEAKLSQLQPVSPREAPAARLTPEEVHARVKSLFDDVVEGRKDFFKASEELYKMWRDTPPHMRADLEAALNTLNRLYGEKYGVTLEPWRPSLLERALRMGEMFVSDARSAVEGVLKGFRQRLERGQTAWLYEAAIDVSNRFRRGEIGLEEARRRLLDLAKKAEKVDKELSETFRKKAEKLGREETAEKPPQTEKRPEVRLPDEKDVEWIRRAEEERRRVEKREEGDGRGQQLLLLERPVSERMRVDYVQRGRRAPVTSLERRATSATEARRSLDAETALRQVLTPETRSALVQALEVRTREADAAADLTAPTTSVATATQLKKSTPLYADATKEVTRPKRRRGIIPLVPPLLKTETPPRYAEPSTSVLKTPERGLKHDVPLRTTAITTPTAVDIATPAYTPATVPKISEVPAVDVPSRKTTPTPQPKRLPSGWWRLLPPSAVADGGKGAYKAQSGKKQVLALA